MDQAQFRRFLSVLKRQWWVIAQAVLVIAGVAALLAQRAPDAPFAAQTVLVAQIETTQGATAGDTVGPFLRAQSQVLKSGSFLANVAAKLPGETAKSLKSALDVRLDASAGTITLRSSSPDPARPVTIVNTVATEFVNSQLNDLTASLRARTEELQRGIDNLQNTINKINTDIGKAQSNLEDTSVLQARKTTALTQYQSLFSSQQELFNQISLKRRPIALLEPATAAKRNPRPSPIRRGALGAAIGLVFGSALVTMRELLDDKVRRRDQVETETGLTVLGELPEEKIRSDRHELPVLEHAHGGLAESLRGLRTALSFIGRGTPLHSVAVTSPQPGDGKTMTAANLALVYAQAGVRTILVSGDLRNPEIDSLFGVQDQPGLAELLAEMIADSADTPDDEFDEESARLPSNFNDRVRLAKHIQFTKIPHLRIVPCGKRAQNPGELLASDAAKRVMADLRSQSDMVIVDCPPMLVADAAIVSGLVDGTVVVVALNRTRRRRLGVALERLSGAPEKILGVVINRSNHRSGFYGGYYPYTVTESNGWKFWKRRKAAA